MPLDDPVAAAIAQNIAEGVIECYEADVNPAGGLFNRPFQLVQYGYRGDPVAAAKVFVDRYPLSALLGPGQFRINTIAGRPQEPKPVMGGCVPSPGRLGSVPLFSVLCAKKFSGSQD